MTQTINELMDRLKSLREFTVEIDIPNGLMLNGVVPFDAKIDGTKGIFKVLALTQDEADEKVFEFLNK